MKRAQAIAIIFEATLVALEQPGLCGAGGREMAIVRTKLEEACFFAKRAMAQRPESQHVVTSRPNPLE